jgi:hypothetical protein
VEKGGIKLPSFWMLSYKDRGHREVIHICLPRNRKMKGIPKKRK